MYEGIRLVKIVRDLMALVIVKYDLIYSVIEFIIVD